MQISQMKAKRSMSFFSNENAGLSENSPAFGFFHLFYM